MTSPAERARNKTKSRPKPITQEFIDDEMKKCRLDFIYWVNTYARIYDNEVKGWIPFTLWDAQIEAARLALENQYVLSLKARQLGFTWLWALALSLWKMLFQPISEILLFSQGEVEALELLSEQRMRGMYGQLPEWMKPGSGSADSKSEFRLANGSGARALPPTRGGDSRTVTDLVIDEADLIDNFSELLARAEPTVGRSGNILLIGRAAKNTPNSPFKKMYKAAKSGDSKYKALFIPWFAHPERNAEWYETQKRDIFARDGSYDSLYEQYPATDTEALQARSLDKRFPPWWIAAVSRERKPLAQPADAPAIPGLFLYKYPEQGRKYGMGGDPSGGTTDGDPAVAIVVDAVTYEQVAKLAGKFEAAQFAFYTADVADYYNHASVLPELNNHGNLYIAKLKERGISMKNGITRTGDTGKPGWLTTERSKNMLYDTAGKVIQELIKDHEVTGKEIEPIICDFVTASEVASIDINTLSAPEGEHDDHSMAWVLALMCVYRGVSSMEIGHHDLWQEEREEAAVPMGTPQARQVAKYPPEMVSGVKADDVITEMLKKRGISGGGRW